MVGPAYLLVNRYELILIVIYGVHDHREKNFIVEVQSILSRLAKTSVVLKEHLNLDIEQLNDPLSRDAATLHLLLHQVCSLVYMNALVTNTKHLVCYFNRKTCAVLSLGACP